MHIDRWFPAVAARSMHESMVTHLVQCQCSGAPDCPKGSEGLEPPRFALRNPGAHLCAKEAPGAVAMTWNAILQDLFASCSVRECRGGLAAVPKRQACIARWRDPNDRRVLAPLALKRNSDNILAGSVDVRKRKCDPDGPWAPAKRARCTDTVKPCSVVVRRASLKTLLLQYKCVSNRSFVRLYDILKEIPQQKEAEEPVTQEQYLGFLGLSSTQSAGPAHCAEIKANHTTKLVSHPHIPFSSDYGRRLLARERHCLPQDVALRKLERTEWYLKGAPVTPKNSAQPEIAFEKRTKHLHTYKFPRRHFSQNHQSLSQSFIRYVCKPVCVVLETIDLGPFIAKRDKAEQPNMVVASGIPGEDISISSDSSVELVTLNGAECGVRNVIAQDEISGNAEFHKPLVFVKVGQLSVSVLSGEELRVNENGRDRLRRSARLNLKT